MEKREVLKSSKGWAEAMLQQAAIEIEKGNYHVPSEYVYKHCEKFFEDDLRSVRYNEYESVFEIEIKH